MSLEILLALTLLGLTLPIGAAIGLRLLRCARLAPNVDLLVLLFSLGIGLGVIAYGVLLIGLIGLLFPWLLGAIALAATLLTRAELAEIARAIATMRPSRPSQPFEMVLLCLLAVFLSLGFLSTLGPLVDHDAQMYHLAAPKLYVQEHRIVWLAENTHANFPATVEMLYTLGLAVGSDQFARMLNFVFGALTAVGLYHFAASRFRRGVGLLSALIFLSIPLVGNASGRAGVDLGLGFFALLAVLALVNWRANLSPTWLIVSGAFGGLAAGTKYTGLQLLVILAVACALVLLMVKEKNPRRWALTPGLPLVTGLAVAAPWYLKNWLVFGNPVFPVYFGGVGWTSRELQLFHDSFAGFGFGHDIPAYLALLPNMMLHPSRFTLDPPGLVSAFLLLAPFAWLARRNDRTVQLLLVVCLLQFAWWSAGMQETRFLLPILPWLSVLSALVLWRGAQSGQPFIRASTHTLSLLAVAPLLILQLQQFGLDGLRVVAGLDTRRDYLARHFEEYSSIEYINTHLPADAKVLLLWRNRGYYLERAYVPDDFYTRFGALYEKAGSPSEVYAALRGMGITHVLVNAVDPPLWEADPRSIFHVDVRLFAAFKQEYLVPIYQHSQNELLKLREN